MTTLTTGLDFVELDTMDAPDDGWDWVRGFHVGIALGGIALAIT